MGKKDRVKGNFKSSSSSRAAELLGNSNFSPLAANFSNFSSFSIGNSFVDDFEGVNEDLKVMLKKLNKRDSTTKIRALEEICTYLNSQTNDSEIKKILPGWSKLYAKISIDVDRRVRILIGNAHLIIVKTLKKKIAPHLKTLIGPWIASTFDPCPDVCKVAKEAYNIAFPSKPLEALIFCQEEILNYISENLFEKTPEQLSDPRFYSKEEIMMKYSRFIVTSIHTLIYLIEKLPKISIQKCQDQYDNIFSNKQLWNFATHEDVGIRKSIYNLIKSLCLNNPDILQCQLSILSPIFPGKVFSEKEVSIYGDAWESLVLITKESPESWIMASHKKPLINKLFNYLKTGSPLSIEIVYPCLITLLDNLPPEIKEKENFYHEFFENFWKGYSNQRIGFNNSKIFMKSYLECIFYVLTKRGIFNSNDLIDLVSNFISNLNASKKIDDSLFNFFNEKYQSLLIEKLINVDESSISKENFISTCQISSTLLIETYKKCLKHRSASNDQINKSQKTYSEGILSKLLEKMILSIKLNDLLSGYSVFISNTVLVLPHLIESKSIMEYLDKIFNDELLQIVGTSIPLLNNFYCLISEYFRVLAKNGENKKLDNTWKNIINAILSQERKDYLSILSNLFERIKMKEIQKDFSLPEVDSIVLDIVDQNEFNKSKTASKLLTTCLSCYNTDTKFISDTTINVCIKKIVDEFNYFSSINYYTSVDGKFSVSSLLTVIELLNVLLDISKLKGSLVRHLPNNYRFDIISKILSFFIFSVNFSEFVEIEEDEEYSRESIQETIQVLYQLSKSIWDNLKLELRQSSVDVNEVKDLISYLLSDRNNAFKDINHHGSPAEFSNQIKEILSLIRDKSEKDNIINKAIMNNQEYWKNLSRTYFIDNILLSIVKEQSKLTPFIYKNMKNKNNNNDNNDIDIENDNDNDNDNDYDNENNNEKNDESVLYDIYGLSFYARLAIFTLNFIKEIGINTFFKKDPVTNVRSRLWVINELILVQNILNNDNLLKTTTNSIVSSEGLKADSFQYDIDQIIETLMSKEKHEINNENEEESLSEEEEEEEEENNNNNIKKEEGEEEEDNINKEVEEEEEDDDDDDEIDEEELSDDYWDNIIELINFDEDIELSKPDTILSLITNVFKIIKESGYHYTSVFNSLLGYALNKYEISEERAEILLTEIIEPTIFINDEIGIFVALPLLCMVREYLSDSKVFTMFKRKLVDKITDFQYSDILASKDSDVYGDVLKSLIYLNACSYNIKQLIDEEFEEEEYIFLSQQQSMFLLKTIMGWFEDQSRFKDIDENINSELCQLLTTLLISLCEVSGNHWEFIINYSIYNLKNADWNSDIGKVLIYHTVNLILSIQLQSEIERSVAEDLLDGFAEYENDIYELLLSLLILICSMKLETTNSMPSTPLSILQSSLAKSCSFIPEEILFEQTCFNELCSVLNTLNSDVQVKTCQLLLRITKNKIQSESLKVETKGLDGTECIPDSLLSIALKAPKIPDKFKFIDNDVNSHKILGYLLSWIIILEHFNDATFELKSVYSTQFRQHNNLLNNFMILICQILNIVKNEQAFDISNWTIDEFDVETFEPNDISICVLSAHLYWKALKNISSLVRTWWNELKNRQLCIALEEYTKKYVTPLLVSSEMNSVISTDRSQYENLVIKANKSRNEIIAQYVIPSEESYLDIVIRIPPTYPLKQVVIDGGHKTGVQESRWRSWILSSSAVMVAQNGNIMDSILVFYNNVKLHFEGVEECTICYSIIGVIDRQLPNKRCRTCKNKFHAACLHKWFQTSNQATCPLCRSQF
ncbi:hypothetical protein BCR32DRAFT_269438 [Anaeromyces robustus]|uniref:E3 ubiquitin-protein ligase listerin n=1 Tax=Anaeromyces robustus TaxID=1754192 RepID=A0A1Y1X120_9FUNG|nr:hypothetical protein BCR32DRAFT_269438 [Anaeromyces robustus]|eukprot:ORX79499.1 hypothetical protein BCR32DRAFT_269438 [Anaeromyces robustus]